MSIKGRNDSVTAFIFHAHLTLSRTFQKVVEKNSSTELDSGSSNIPDILALSLPLFCDTFHFLIFYMCTYSSSAPLSFLLSLRYCIFDYIKILRNVSPWVTKRGYIFIMVWAEQQSTYKNLVLHPIYHLSVNYQERRGRKNISEEHKIPMVQMITWGIYWWMMTLCRGVSGGEDFTNLSSAPLSSTHTIAVFNRQG